MAAKTTSEFDLTPLISDPDNNVDLTSLTIITPPAEATATLNGTLLQLDYSNTTFVGAETILLEVCDQLISCTQQALSINVVGELEIYNALSPNGDLKNEIFYATSICYPTHRITKSPSLTDGAIWYLRSKTITIKIGYFVGLAIMEMNFLPEPIFTELSSKIEVHYPVILC
ncbi:MAG TPA: hypothetical protein PLJ08_18905 [Cyclobacteriaceae bacterium]|nr:hypothetical protein [Cyclobacteriaceae bacterium]